MGRNFRVLLAIKKRPHDQPIHFKLDGERFVLQRTVKMNVNSKYALEFTLRPPQDVEGLKVEDENVPVFAKDKDAESAMYRAEWLTTGLTKSKKGTRNQLAMSLQLKGAGELKVELQVKYYSETEQQHTCWGPMVNQIEYECKVPEKGALLGVDIVKETFR